MKYKYITKIITIFFILSIFIGCQPIEDFDDIIFDNTLLSKININAENRYINNVYEINYAYPSIDYSLGQTPLELVNNWLSQNINVFGTENKLIINILDASVIKLEKEISNKKKYAEKNEFFYELSFAIEFILYDDSEFVLATAFVESKHSTTSGKFISLNEKEQIINTLILDSLIDLSLKSEELLKEHMYKYIL